MPETFKAVFKIGKQRNFIENALNNISIKDLAKHLSISERTLRDWRREKYKMPVVGVNLIAKLAKIEAPSFDSIPQYEHSHRAGRLGAQAVLDKYGEIGGDPENRRIGWQRWWEQKGRFLKNPILKPKPVHLPRKSVALAEFVGIMMGDGGISKYQIAITLHSEEKCYKIFIIELIRKLFGVKAGTHKYKYDLANTISVSRIELVKFCTKILGLPLGDKIKQKLNIPEWINKNLSFQKACVRGLMDTDGCLVIHKYRVNGRRYCYKKISFSSASPLLAKSVIEILKRFDFKPRLSHNGRNVWIDSQKEAARYLKVFGSHNPKHLERFRRGG